MNKLQRIIFSTARLSYQTFLALSEEDVEGLGLVERGEIADQIFESINKIGDSKKKMTVTDPKIINDFYGSKQKGRAKYD